MPKKNICFIKYKRPILHLRIDNKSFNSIANGIKKEDYRDVKPFYQKKFKKGIKIKNNYYHPTEVLICFSDGVGKNRNKILIECNGLKLKTGNPKWGAKAGITYYTLLLGKILV